MLEFKNTPYSKEQYESVNTKAENNKKSADKIREAIWDYGGGLFGAILDYQSAQDIKNLMSAYEKAQIKLKEMRGKAQGEALKTNEQYDRLLENAKRANEYLYNFQKEKLGLHNEEIAEEKIEK